LNNQAGKMAQKEDVLNSFESAESVKATIPEKLTVLPLRDIIIFPHMIFPVLIGRNTSLKSVAEAVERDKFIFVSAQKNPQEEEPGFQDIYKNGTIARIIQVLRLPNNLLKVLVEGLTQGKIVKEYKNTEFLEAKVSQTEIKYAENDKELQAALRIQNDLFVDYIDKDNNIPPDILTAFDSILDPVQKMYFVATNVKAKVEKKQKILQFKTLKRQLFELNQMMREEIEMMTLESEIDSKIQDSMQKTQKKFFIQEQIRALQNELGDDDENVSPEMTSIKEMLDKAELPEHAKEKADEEFERLKKTPTMSPEFSVNRTYLEWLAQVPWNFETEDVYDIQHVKKILDEDHYDLEKPKDRILEYIAVLNLSGALKKQILCFVGPPGVGKTSLAKSIARALGRKFVRFSLGGVRDEAEIRGHRRTYIGAMPGKIIQSMKKAGSTNPVILLDEVDKMAMDFRGDPSSALLEVLDPEQNVAFNDHYLEVDYDLSKVMFITTANVKYDIPLPLQDRMEIIELHSYLDPEKLEIAKRHIIPKVFEEFGLNTLNIVFEDAAILKIIREYTRESGVRNLEREISSVLRKLAKEVVSEYDSKRKSKTERKQSLQQNPYFKKSYGKKKFVITEERVEEYLKAPRFKNKKEDLDDKIGIATGLAWTSVGGEVLPVEVTIMPGSEKLTLTGKLGDVMKESAMAALSYVRSNAKDLGVKTDFNKKKEIHVHVPEGAIPKDGPSAGITITMALISAATGKKLDGKIAMTGEVNLRGQVTAIGGLKEKLLAAKRIGVTKVLVPEDNRRDIDDIKEDITSGLEIIPVKNIKEAVEHAFV
jgi:ATP-dependent Lon protease